MLKIMSRVAQDRITEPGCAMSFDIELLLSLPETIGVKR